MTPNRYVSNADHAAQRIEKSQSLNQMEPLMNMSNKQSDWQYNPVIIGLLVMFCFPFGLILVWLHPTWEQRTKWIITGVFALFIVFVGISGEQEKARITALLAQADSDWAGGKRAEAVTVYKTVEDKHWLAIADAARPTLLSRIVEFHADAGQDDEAQKWIATAKGRGVALQSSSPKVTALLVAAEEQLVTTATASKAEPQRNTGYELGKEFQLGDYKYKIIRLERQSQIGEEAFGDFIGERASPGASFVIVTYTIENCTNESQVVRSDDFSLKDSQGRTFDTSSKVSTALLIYTEDKDFLLSELQPGIPRQMQQGFELPNKTLEAELTLIVPKKGLFSRGDARLNVSVW